MGRETIKRHWKRDGQRDYKEIVRRETMRDTGRGISERRV